MVTQLDNIVKKYPDVIADLLANGRTLAINKTTGEACPCHKMTCDECLFGDENNPDTDWQSCDERILDWLKKPVGFEEQMDADDTRNSNGEITW